jgi:hypothetical protein
MKTVLFFQPTFFSLVPSATQILTKIEKQNLLGDANVLLLGEETKRFFTAFTANTALFHSAKRNAEIAH